MKLVALLFCSVSLWANACLSQANGNWSNPAVWTSCGGGVPGNGDSAKIVNSVVIDQNIGTSDAGIKNIQVFASGASLTVDGAAPRTILFGSTGLDPVGNGSISLPGSTATMFGFLIDWGTFDTSNATPTNVVTIGPANPSYATYIRHIQFGGPGGSVPVTIHLKNCVLNHLGVNVDGFLGVYDQSDQAGEVLTIDHNLFQNCYMTAFVEKITNASYTFNTISGTTSAQSVYSYKLNPGFTMTDNTELGVVATGNMFASLNVSSGLTFARNAVISASGFGRGLVADSTAAYDATSSSNTFQSNLSVAYSGSGESGAISLASNTNAGIIDSNIFVNPQVGVLTQGCAGCGSGGNATITNNIFIQSSFAVDHGQGMIMVQRGLATISGNMGSSDSTTDTGADNNFTFCYNAGDNNSSLLEHHNSFSSSTSGTQHGWGISVGEPGFPCAITPIVRDNILFGGSVGINDFAANIWATDFASAGSHHNNVYGTTSAYSTQGTSSNFTDGTHTHPSATYGDVSINPGFVDISRRLAGYDLKVGGAGTDADYFTMLSNRCGLTGTSYNAAYDITKLYNWMRAGFSPTEIRLANLASDGTQIGALKPIGMIGAFLQ